MISPARGVRVASGDRGYSLIELLIALSIGLSVLGTATVFVVTQVRAQTGREQISRMQQGGRLGMEVLLRELRMAGLDPTKLAGATLTLAQAHSVGFTMDSNGDGDVLDLDEEVSYELLDMDGDGRDDLVRSTADGEAELVTHSVSALTFRYVLSDGSTVYEPDELSEVRQVLINILMHADSAESNAGDARYWMLSAGTQLRNMALKE